MSHLLRGHGGAGPGAHGLVQARLRPQRARQMHGVSCQEARATWAARAAWACNACASIRYRCNIAIISVEYGLFGPLCTYSLGCIYALYYPAIPPYPAHSVWAEHQTKALGKELTCPLCRTSWGDFKWRPPPLKRRRPDETHEQLSNAAHLGTSCSVCRKVIGTELV